MGDMIGLTDNDEILDWDEDDEEEVELRVEKKGKAPSRKKSGKPKKIEKKKKNKKMIVGSIIAVLVIFILISVSVTGALLYIFLYEDSNDDDDNDDIPDNNNVKADFVLPEDDVAITDVSVGNDSITYTYEGEPGEVDYSVGDIISGTTGFGYLRKVTDVIIDGNVVTVKSESATLLDVVDEVNISVNQTIDLGGELTRSSRTYNFDRTLYSSETTKVDFLGEATVSDPRLVFEVEYDILDGLNWLMFYVEQTYTCSIGILATHSTTIEKETTIATYYLTPITVPVGPVPVVLTPQIEFVVGAELNLEANARASIDMSLTLQAGIYYNLGEWHPYTYSQHDIDYDPPVFEASVEAMAYAILPKFSLLIYGVVGPSVEIQPYLQFEASLDSNPMWTIHAGIDAYAGVTMEINYLLDTYLVADVLIQVMEMRWLVAQAPLREAPYPPTLSLPSSSSTGDYTVSWNPVLDATSYTLEEDDNIGFSSPSVIYTGSDTSKDNTGKKDGTYFYRVKATNDIGDSEWSDVKSITVNIGDIPGTEVIKINGVDFEFVTISSGSFVMGGNWRSDEEPPHNVNIGYSFQIGQFEITQSQWESLMDNNPSYFSGINNPVEQISWDDCQEFINKITLTPQLLTHR